MVPLQVLGVSKGWSRVLMNQDATLKGRGDDLRQISASHVAIAIRVEPMRSFRQTTRF